MISQIGLHATVRRAATPDLGALLGDGLKEPIDVAEVTLAHYEVDDSHSLDQVVHTPDGRTYLSASSFDTSRDRDKDPGGYAVALGPDGKQLWRYDAPGGFGVRSLTVSSNGHTYLLLEPESHYTAPLMVTLDSQGQTVWTHEPKEYPHPKLDSVRPFGDQVFLKAEKTVTALDAQTGKVNWRKDLSIYPSSYFHVVYPNGDQVFANDDFSNNFGNDHFERISATGQKKRHEMPNFSTFPVRVDDKLIYGSDHGSLAGVDLATGKSWKLDTDSERGLATPWLGRDGRIYAKGRHDDHHYCFTAEGQMVWHKELDLAPGGITDEPFKVGPDGTVVYAAGDDSGLHLLDRNGNETGVVPITDFRDFAPDDQGNLYVFDSDDRLVIIPPGGDKRYVVPLQFKAHDWWDLERVDNGQVELKSNSQLLRLSVTPSTVTQRLTERVLKPTEPTPAPPQVEQDGDWLVIGDISIPVEG